MVGIVYLGLLMVLFMVWLGSKQMRSLSFGFSLTSMLNSHSVGWVTGLIIPSSESLFDSSFNRPKFATGTRRFGACTGVTEVFVEFAESRPKLRLFRLHKSSNSPEPAHPFR